MKVNGIKYRVISSSAVYLYRKCNTPLNSPTIERIVTKQKYFKYFCPLVCLVTFNFIFSTASACKTHGQIYNSAVEIAFTGRRRNR
jgi:hypothetical protein